MQGQKNIGDLFPEAVELNQGSVSNSSGMNQSTAWNNSLNPVESQLSNYTLSSGEGHYTCMGAGTHGIRGFSGWDLGESSSSVNSQNQFTGEGLKIDHGRSSSFSTLGGVYSRCRERHSEPSSTFLPNNSGLHGNQMTGGRLAMQNSSSNPINLNASLNAGSVSGVGGAQAFGAGACPDVYKFGQSDMERGSYASSSNENVGTSSGNAGYLVDDDGVSGSSPGSWGLSCKRKALEGTSGQSHTGASSSCFQQAENNSQHTVSPHYNGSSSLPVSSTPMNLPTVSQPELLNPRIGVGMRGVASDVFPPFSVAGVAESLGRTFSPRLNMGHQESMQYNLSLAGNVVRHSNIPSTHESSRHIPYTDYMDTGSAPSATTNLNIPLNQSRSMHVTRNVPAFPRNGPLNSRSGGSSSPLMLSGERGAPLRDEPNFRTTQRNNMEHSMSVPAAEMSNLAQDPAYWGLVTGNSRTSGNVPSSSRIGPSSSARPFHTPWTPHHNPSAQNHQRLSEFSPWALFPSLDSSSGGQRSPFNPFPSGASSSSEETMTSSGANSHSHHSPYARSALLMEVPTEDINGWRVLAADIEGRQRLVSEIRHVLNAMRRGETLRAEDYMFFDPFVNGVAELHDRHRDMRLDVDNMSYEELLALEERIGNVNTGLTVEAILESMQQKRYLGVTEISSVNVEPCCICQEVYNIGDDIGTLDCGHDFHTNCIKQWLTQKNLCPICKTTALNTCGK